MSILTVGPEEIQRRKTASDNKNNTADLTFESGNSNPRAAAYKNTRELLDDKEIEYLSASNDEVELLAEMEKLEKEWINE